jgi:pSer/pThr/pTyr-binding forkhead associated (FHA) protein
MAAAPPAAGPAARLSLRFPAEPSFSVEMRHSPFRVGRRKDNDAPLPVDSSSGVSGNHLTITFERSVYFLLDETSKFGTSINGKPVTKGEPTQLTDGDLIGLGPIVKVVFTIL